MGGGIYDGTYPPNDKFLKAAVSMSDERIVALDLVQHSGLTAIADGCHDLAEAQGKFPSTWTYAEGARQMIGECREWLAELEMGNEVGAKREFGDILATVLSIGHHMGYDPEDELRAAIQRNAQRAREGV
jgi:NTP pyrophosphatase (non-canonical NTP hydrolase)